MSKFTVLIKEEYDYNIVYWKSKENTNADALSRIKSNALENESTLVNIGDQDEEIENIVENVIQTDGDRQDFNAIAP